MARVEDFYVSVPKNGQENDGEDEKTIRALRQENRLLDNRYYEINRRLLAVSDKCDDWKKKCKAWKEKCYDWEDKFYDLEDKCEALEDQQREIPVLRQIVKDLERSNEHWKGKYLWEEATRRELEAALWQQHLQTTPIHIQNENRKLKAENENQVQQIELLNRCLDDLRQQLYAKNATQDQLGQKDTLIHINQTLITKKDELLHENQQRIVNLEQTNMENAHISAFGVKVKSLEHELMETNDKLTQLEEVLDDIECMSGQKDKEIESLKIENKKLSDEKTELEMKYLKLQKDHERQIDTFDGDVTNLNKLGEMKRETEKLATAWHKVKVVVLNNATATNEDNNNQPIDEQLQQVLTEINEKDQRYNKMRAFMIKVIAKLRKSREMGQSHDVPNREGEVSNRSAINETSVCLMSPAGDSGQSSSLTVNGTERMDVDTSDSAAEHDIPKTFLTPDNTTDEKTTSHIPAVKMEEKGMDEDTDTEVDIEND